METMEWRFVDKSEFKAGRGPWNDEPDKVQWPDETTGLACMVHRGPAGALCGYVGVPFGHRLHGKDYNDSSVEYDTPEYEAGINGVSVHGGLTYAAACGEIDEQSGKGLCHIPAPGEPESLWWFGFDCAHLGDICPSYDDATGARYGGRSEYRNLAYVKHECAGLARQLAALA